jgi:hypothetical protein
MGRGVCGEESEKWEAYKELIAQALAYDTPTSQTDVEEELASRRFVKSICTT